MRFGIFGSAQARRDVTRAEAAKGFRDYVEAQVEAEALGMHATFLVEHHFTGMGQVSASLDLLAWVAARTTTLRVGTAVIVVPWHNPILLAEQAATLDLMSGGRLDLGIGRGYRHNEFDGFCMDPAEADSRFEEAVGLMKKAWSSDRRFSHEGRHWRFHDIVVEPPPAQSPHPPLWIAAGKAESIKRVAALGCNLLLDQFADCATIGQRIALFKLEVEAGGRQFDPLQVAVARNIYVAKDRTDAAEALERQAQQHQRMVALSQRPDGSNRSHITAYAAQAGGTEGSAIYGSPDRIAEELTALHAAGVRYVLINGGGHLMPTLRRFSAELLPAFSQELSEPDRGAVATG